ncbi:unnamed protein product [Enterobius vermicularis]|uniref:Histone H4 n=1 Tax=Enterobius vermicularis TaxID=51028 RepID=A0A0N4UZL5_ENTVE|nr:unnamed protein product [Enterobius vermicularis]
MSGCRKGGKGLGKGSAKRHCKVLRDKIQQITKPASDRLSIDEVVWSVSPEIETVGPNPK